MELVADLVKIILPSGLILWAMYLTVSSFIKKDLTQKSLEIKARNLETILPIRIQAYERMTLFLERITPNNLLVRLSGRSVHSLDFQQLLLSEIRDEFSHNLSQQIYMSAEAWEAIRRAQQEITTLINLASKDISPDTPSIELSKRIMQIVIENGANPTEEALKIIKEEFRSNFL